MAEFRCSENRIKSRQSAIKRWKRSTHQSHQQTVKVVVSQSRCTISLQLCPWNVPRVSGVDCRKTECGWRWGSWEELLFPDLGQFIFCVSVLLSFSDVLLSWLLFHCNWRKSISLVTWTKYGSSSSTGVFVEFLYPKFGLNYERNLCLA